MLGMGSGEVKITYEDGKITRAIRGILVNEDEVFIHLQRRDGDLRINKARVIKIERGRDSYGV